MNKELIEKVLWTISEELLEGGHVLESERIPLAQEIIKLCKDEALDAVKVERTKWQSGGMAELGIDCAVDAIKVRME